MAMNVKVGACALLMVLALWAIGTPVDAATASGNVRSVVAASGFGSRQVAWVEGDSHVWLQRLNADGTRNGAPVDVKATNGDRYVTSEVSVFPVDHGVSLVGWGQLSLNDRHGLFAEVTPSSVYWLGYSLCDHPDLPAGKYPATGVVRKNTTTLMVAACGSEGLQWLREESESADWSTETIDMGSSVSSVSIALAPSSSIIVVVFTYIGPTGDLDVAAQRFTNAVYPEPIGAPIAVASGVGDQFQPQVAASGSNYLITWIQGAGRDVVGRIVNSGGLGSKKVLVDAGGNQNHPWAAAAPNGGWHLVWADLRGGNNDVYSARVGNTLEVSPKNGTVVAGGAGAQSAPTVAPSAGTGGKAFVAYLDGGNGYIRNLTATSTPTGTSKLVTVTPK